MEVRQFQDEDDEEFQDDDVEYEDDEDEEEDEENILVPMSATSESDIAEIMEDFGISRERAIAYLERKALMDEDNESDKAAKRLKELNKQLLKVKPDPEKIRAILDQLVVKDQ